MRWPPNIPHSESQYCLCPQDSLTIENRKAIINGYRALAVAVPLELSTEGAGKNVQVLAFSGSIYTLKAIA